MIPFSHLLFFPTVVQQAEKQLRKPVDGLQSNHHIWAQEIKQKGKVASGCLKTLETLPVLASKKSI